MTSAAIALDRIGDPPVILTPDRTNPETAGARRDHASLLACLQLTTGRFQRDLSAELPIPDTPWLEDMWRDALSANTESAWHLLPEDVLDRLDERLAGSVVSRGCHDRQEEKRDHEGQQQPDPHKSSIGRFDLEPEILQASSPASNHHPEPEGDPRRLHRYGDNERQGGKVHVAEGKRRCGHRGGQPGADDDEEIADRPPELVPVPFQDFRKQLDDVL